MADPRRRSPLAHRAPLTAEGGTLTIAERPLLGRLVLRVDADKGDAAVATVIGAGLPKAVAETALSEAATIFWLSPDEWMIVTAAEAEERLAADLGAALAGIHHQIAVVSDYYTAIEIAGARARDLLSKLTTLDMHARAFKPGEARAGIFAKANGVLFQRVADDAGGGPAFDLAVRWSMADYLWCVVAEAGHEWGLPVEHPVAGEPLFH